MIDAISDYFVIIYKSIETLLTTYSSKIIVSLVILVTGLILATIASWLTSYLLDFIKPIMRKKEAKEVTKRLICNIVYWVILITFLYWAVISLQLPWINAWLTNVNKFIPQILIAVLIILTGYIFSRIVRTAIIQVSSTATMRLTADLLAVFIIAVSVLSAIDQIDINASLINAIFLITFSLIFGGFIVLLILASFSIVREMMSARFISDTYTIGQHISAGKYEGKIEMINTTSVHIKQNGLTVIIPAKMLLDNPVTIINDSKDE